MIKVETRQFEIHFDDLTKTTQYYFCEHFKTTPEEESKEVPLITISREIEIEEKEKD